MFRATILAVGLAAVVSTGSAFADGHRSASKFDGNGFYVGAFVVYDASTNVVTATFDQGLLQTVDLNQGSGGLAGYNMAFEPVIIGVAARSDIWASRTMQSPTATMT